MRFPVQNFAALCAVLFAALVFPLHAQTVVHPGDARVIVKLKPDAAVLKSAPVGVAPEKARADALAKRIGVPLRAGIRISDRAQVVFASGVTPEELARRLSLQDDVEYAVPDRRARIQDAPNDPLYSTGGANGPAVGQWYLRAPSGEIQSSIDVEPAWSVTTGSPTIVVADLDTGVRFDHPDLLTVAQGGNLLPGYDMITFPNSNDGGGRDADASDPGDWVTAEEVNDPNSFFYQCTEKDPSSGQYVAQDSTWHGTQVAGLIVAITNNGVGMASVGRTVRLLPVRVIGKCAQGFESDIVAGMRWAAGLSVPGTPPNPTRAQVINMSLGSEGSCSTAYQDAVDEIVPTGTTIVVSAGNDAGHAVGSPANCRGVIAVAGLRHVGTKVGFSNLGPEVAIAAPGGNCVNTAPGTPCLYPILSTSNAGAMGPTDSIYTDSFDITVGTSFSAPLVSGTVALMLSVQPALTPAEIKALLQATARPFPTTGADVSSGPVFACTAPQYDATNQPVDQLECYCTTQACGAGMLDAGAAVTAVKTGLAIPPVQAQGLWWNSPAGSESGWGINFAHQGDVIFATWFTYDSIGRPWWLSMTANKIADNAYSGTLYQTRGPAFNAVPFSPSLVVSTPLGTATISFTDANDGTFSYTVNGTTQTKSLTRQVFGTLPTCVWGAQADLALATNYQDLWWAAPPGSESGWGINLTEESNIIFATWFTYGLDGTATWLSMTATSTGANTWGGVIYRTAGPSFDSVPFRPARVVATPVGNGTLTFTDGNTASFAYTVNGISQVKPITRQVFRAPGTVCQ